MQINMGVAVTKYTVIDLELPNEFSIMHTYYEYMSNNE